METPWSEIISYQARSYTQTHVHIHPKIKLRKKTNQERMSNSLFREVLNATGHFDLNMGETQNDLLVHDRTLNHDFLDTIDLCPDTGVTSEKKSSRDILSFHSPSTTSHPVAEPYLFDIASSSSKQTTPQQPQKLEEPFCSSEAQQPENPAVSNWADDEEKASQSQDNEEKKNIEPATQCAEADLAFLLDTHSPVLPLSGAPPVLGKQIRDELDALSLLQGKGVAGLDNLNSLDAAGPLASGNPQLAMDGNPKHTMNQNENNVSQLLQSAMYFMPKACYNNESLPEQTFPQTQPVTTDIPASEPKRIENDFLDSSIFLVGTGSAPLSRGMKRTFAAAAVAAVGGRGYLGGVGEDGEETPNQEGGQRCGKRTKYGSNARENNQQGIKPEGRGRNGRKWKAIEPAATMTAQISDEELRKMRRVKNRASVEKCRTKQRLRMEALQVEQKCLMSECTVIKEALGKVENVLRESCQRLGVPDQVRERVNRFLEQGNDALGVTTTYSI